MLGGALDLSALALRQRASGPAPWDFDLTTGVLPPVMGVARASTATYVDASGLIASAAVNAARFDCDPVSHAVLGVLLEPQATYYGPSSEDVGGTGWSLGSGATMTPVAADSPLRLDDVVSSLGLGSQSYSAVQTSTIVPIGAGETQCWLIRNVDALTTRIVYRDSTIPAQVSATITWASATAGAAITSIATSAAISGITCTGYGSVPMGGGWHLVWVAFTFPPTVSANYLRIDPSASPVGKSVWVAAAWVVSTAATEPPSYLQTTSGSLTRDADVLTISDTSRAYEITYLPLAGGGAQTLQFAAGVQPSGLPACRATRVRQL